MSNDRWSATNDDPTEFSYGTNEQNYTGIYLDQDFLEGVSITVPNKPENIGETANCNKEVSHTLSHLNPLKQNSVRKPGTLVYTDDLNETPLSLNVESDQPVIKSYYRNNTILKPFNTDYIFNNSNIRNKKKLNYENQNSYTEPYFHTTLPRLVPEEQGENGELSTYKVVDSDQSYSTTFTPPDLNRYTHYNNDVGIQEYDRISPGSSHRYESVIKYCQPTQKQYETFSTPIKDLGQKRQGQNKFEHRFDNLAGIRQYQKETYLNEDLRIINMKLKNMSTNYRFGVVNDLNDLGNFNEFRGEPLVNNTQNELGAETFIDCNRYLKSLNTDQNQKTKLGEMSKVVNLIDENMELLSDDETTNTYNELEQYPRQKTNIREMSEVMDLCSDNVTVVNDIETVNPCDGLEQYHQQKNVHKKSIENDQKQLKETVDRIIDNLNDDICGLSCTTTTHSQKSGEMFMAHNLNYKTKNNIGKANENILTFNNSNFDNPHQNVDNITGIIETNKNYKRLTKRPIEYSTSECIQKQIDFSNENTANIRNIQNYDTGLFATKFNNPKFMSMVKEHKSQKINNFSENSEKHNPNNYETNVENIFNEELSVIDHRNKSEKKTHGEKSNKCNTSKENYNYSEIYKDKYSSQTDSSVLKIVSAFENSNADLVTYNVKTSDKQVSNKQIIRKLVRQKMNIDEIELMNEPDGIDKLVNENSNITKIRVRDSFELMANNESEIINSIETINTEPYDGVQSISNTSTECVISATNVGNKTQNIRDKLSISVQNSNKITESNLIGSNSCCYENRRSSIDLEKLIHDTIGPLGRDTNKEDSLKSNTDQSLANSEHDGSGVEAGDPHIECSDDTSDQNSKIYYTSQDLICESNKEVFKIVCVENVDDTRCMLYTEHQNTDTSQADTHESFEDATQSLNVSGLFGNLIPVGRVYKSIARLEEKIPKIKNQRLSEQILNKNYNTYETNELNYESSDGLIKQENFENSNDEQSLTFELQDTGTDETELNKPFEDSTQSPKDCFIGDGKPDDHKDDKDGTGTEESVDYILNENSETRVASEINKEYVDGPDHHQNLVSAENQDTEINEFIDPADQLSDVRCFPDDGPPADKPPADVEPVGEHFEMDYFYNIIKIKHSLFRVNLHTEDDIFNFIQLYSQRTQTSWRVLKSFKSRKYDVCKIFGCLHNGLYKLLKKTDKKIKLNKCACQSKIEIKIKNSTTRGKKSDPYLTNGLPAIVKFKNSHNHLVHKLTELPLLKSITDITPKKTIDIGFEPAEIFQANVIENRQNQSSPVVDTTSSLEVDHEAVVDTDDLSTINDSPENVLLSDWENVKVQCDVVQTKRDEHGLKPGQQIINNGKRVDADGTSSYRLVDTGYSKKYSQEVKEIMSDDVKAKWISNKMATEADQVCLYKCSGKKCNSVFSGLKPFVSHLSAHYRYANIQKETRQFMICMYCFKSFNINKFNELANHITDNYTFCKYFCRYCLFRAYTASHVFVHEYMIHKEQKPSILKLKDCHDRRKEIVKAVDFNKFVLRYICNIGRCTFYSYMNSDFLSHLSQDHEHCDQFSCAICAKSNDKGLFSLNPKSFVKHFNLHSMNTYQCIFCLYGAECINVMIIHLAMEHFEYESLCLERRPIDNFCDDKKIENLKILNIKKCIPADIIKVVDVRSAKDLINNNQINEMRQPHSGDICTANINNTAQHSSRNTKHVKHSSKNKPKPTIDTKNNIIISDKAKKNITRIREIPNVGSSIVNDKKNLPQESTCDIINKYPHQELDKTCKFIEFGQTDHGNTSKNAKMNNIDITNQLSTKNSKRVYRSSKRTPTIATRNKNTINTPDEDEENIPRDIRRISNVESSIVYDKKESSQQSNYNKLNDTELKKDIEIPNQGKRLKPDFSDELNNRSNKYANQGLDKTRKCIEFDQTDDGDTSTNAKTINIDNTNQLSTKNSKRVDRSSKHTPTTATNNKNNNNISDKDEENIPRDMQRIPNVRSSIVNYNKKSSKLSNSDIKNNVELKKDIVIPIQVKHLKPDFSDEPINSTNKYENQGLDKTFDFIEFDQIDHGDTNTNVKTISIDNTNQLATKNSKKIDFFSKNTTTVNNNKYIIITISDEDEENVPQDTQRIQNVGSSIVEDQKKSSQESNPDIINNVKKQKTTTDNKNSIIVSDKNKEIVPRGIQQNVGSSIVNDNKKSSKLSNSDIKNNVELKKDIVIPIQVKHLKPDFSNEPINSSNEYEKQGLDKTSDFIEFDQIDHGDTNTNVKMISIDNTNQLATKNSKKIDFSSKNTTTVNNNKYIIITISDEDEENVPQDTQRIQNVGSSIVEDKKKSSQESNPDIINNVKKQITTTDTKNIIIISDEDEEIVPRDIQRNVGSSIVNDNKKSSQCDVSNNDIIKSVKLKKDNETLIKVKRLQPRYSNKPINRSKKYAHERLNNKCEIIEIRQTDPTDPLTITKTIHLGNTNQLSRKKTGNICYPPKITPITTAINNKNIVPWNAQVPNDTKIPTKGKCLEICLSDDSNDRSEEFANESLNDQRDALIFNKSSDKVFPVGKTYQDHLNHCPTESPVQCTFCLAHSKSTFDLVDHPKFFRRNVFKCTFCYLEFPSSISVKSHVREVHHVFNVKFIPSTANATDIDKCRFLVYEDKCLKPQKRANDCIISTENCKSATIGHMKRSKVISTPDDSQLTTFSNTTYTSKHQIKRSLDESEQQQKTIKRKHSTESFNNVDYKRTPSSQYRLNDNLQDATIDMCFSPGNIHRIPQTQYFSKPMGCLLCGYQTKVRSNLVSHLRRYKVGSCESTDQNSKSVAHNSKPVFTSMNVISSSRSSFKDERNDKIKSAENNVNVMATTNITPPSCKPGTDIPQFIPRNKRFKCCLLRCNYTGVNMESLKRHMLMHKNIWYFVCPHCEPMSIICISIDEITLHLNFHGTDLFICQYCEYIHYRRSKIEAHQKRKHPARLGSENEFNILAIRRQMPTSKTIRSDQQTAEWICNICNSGVKYTKTEIAAHLSTVHKISYTFKCTMCQFDHRDYVAFEEHFKSNHPSMAVKYMTVYFSKVSPDVELQPVNKPTNVDDHAFSKQHPSLNVPEALDGIAEPTTTILERQEIPIKSTPTCEMFTNSLSVSEDQGKIIGNTSNEPDNYLKLIRLMAKYVCPVCNVFVIEEKESFREHLLNEINCTLWKCLECLTICDSAEKMEIHVIKHKQANQKYEKIESSKKHSLVDEMIEYQNILIEYEILKRNNQNTKCDEQNETKVIKATSSLFN